MKFRKKPVVIDALRWTGDLRALYSWLGEFRLHVAPPNDETECGACVRFDYTSEAPKLRIPTREGVMVADSGDWIIRGVKGEFYPCKPDIFAATYDEVEYGEPER